MEDHNIDHDFIIKVGLWLRLQLVLDKHAKIYCDSDYDGLGRVKC